MKWYKHISDSLDDPFIFDLIEEFGGDGYLVFFGVLEIYAREFLPEKNWKLDGSLAFFAQKLHVSVSKFKKIILKIYKWELLITGNRIIIYIPKFTNLLDEWTARKTAGKYRELLPSQSGVARKILMHEVELDIDKDIKANIILSPQCKKTAPVDNSSVPDPNPADFDQPSKAALKVKPKDKKPGDENTDLRELIAQVKVKHPNLAIDTWYGKNMRCHPDAILHVLRSLLRSGDNTEHPMAYIQKAIDIENGKYNARDVVAEHEARKQPITEMRLGSILNAAASRAERGNVDEMF